MDERSRDARWTGSARDPFRRQEEMDFAKGQRHGIFGGSWISRGIWNHHAVECSTSRSTEVPGEAPRSRNVSFALMNVSRYNCRLLLGVPIRAHWLVRAVSRWFTYANYSRITGDPAGMRALARRPCAKQEGDGGRFRGPGAESAKSMLRHPSHLLSARGMDNRQPWIAQLSSSQVPLKYSDV